MAWCRAYLSAKYLAWPQFPSTILGILVFFSCGKSTSHMCKWMHIYAHLHCILCEYMYKCSFWGRGRGISACQELKEFNWYCTNGLVPKDARACICTFLAATKQLYEWYFLSVCPSVRLSHLFDYVPIIVSSWNFQELSHWTRVRSMQKVKVRGQRSRSQRSRPKFSFPDCNSSLNSHMMMKWYI